MKRLEFRRHGLKGTGIYSEVLSLEGLEQARKIGESMNGRGFTHIVLTPFFRTAQTAAAFAEGAGDFKAAEMLIEPALSGPRYNDWVVATRVTRERFGPGKESLENIRKVLPDLVESETLRLWPAITSLIDRLPNGCNVLVVGHLHIIECTILCLTGKVFGPLKECEGVVLTVKDDGSYEAEEVFL